MPSPTPEQREWTLCRSSNWPKDRWVLVSPETREELSKAEQWQVLQVVAKSQLKAEQARTEKLQSALDEISEYTRLQYAAGCHA